MKKLAYTFVALALFSLVSGCATSRGRSDLSDEAMEGASAPARDGLTATRGYNRPATYPVNDYRNVLSDPGHF